MDPETKHPILPSLGYFDGRTTRHSFVRREKVETDDNRRSATYALIYTCDETGVERRWGLE